jgi:methyl-accepting chemotaxis protein
MTLLDNLSLRSKLFLAPVLCLALLALSAADALWGFSQQRRALDSLYADRLPSYGFVANFESGLREMNGLIVRSIGYEAMGYNAKEIGAVDDALKRLAVEMRDSLAARRKAATAADERETLKAIAGMFESYDKAVVGALDMKSAGPAIASTYLSMVQAEFEKLIRETSKVSAAKLKQAGQDVAAASESARLAGMTIGALALAALVSGVLVSLWVARRLLQRMRALKIQTERLAEGDLTEKVEVQGRDEVGQLMRSVATVRDRLAESLRVVQHAAEGVNAAAGEIATGNSDLSRRTEHQASSLQQTAASMEQMNAAVKTNAENAHQANQVAVQASDVAVQGGEVVDRVVSTMNEITASSRRIADIIGTIDGIAFQTNILALNAAVEAARAGEQGRGFAVVAAEVRTLAQRSAEAAREIKVLIGESVDRVEVGAQLVGNAGATMKEIVVQVKRVSGLIGEITGAAAEQSRGIDQVGHAVSQLDEVTQQNAALVEQSAAAAESLKAQADTLARAVGVFRLARA